MAERVALVTGASRGIGRATAVGLAQAGMRVMAVARAQGALEDLAARAGVEALAADLSTPEGCAQAIEATRARLGPIAVLVNNAGRGGFHDRPIFEQSAEGWRATMAVNLDAPFELTRLAAGDMRDAGWGRIVMVSSTSGQVGAPANAAYGASKQGLLGFMRCVAHDVAPFGITCNAVLPGWVRTEMAEHDAALEAQRRRMTTEAVWAERAASYPAGRVVDAEEVARVIAFLASDAASGVNGEAITVALGSPW